MIPGHLRVEPAKALAERCPACEEWLLEAWERMTFGGVQWDGFKREGSRVITITYAGMTSGGRFAAR